MQSRQRRLVVEDVRHWMDNTDHPWPPQMACLYWADAVVTRLRLENVKACLQAGSMSWLCIYPEDDDGVRPTHFSYKWEWGPTTVNTIMQGRMPEMHVWAGIPDSNEIIDLTTKYHRDQCKLTAGFDWTGASPPDYLWCDANRLPDQVYYEPDKNATALATQFLIQTMADRAQPSYFYERMIARK